MIVRHATRTQPLRRALRGRHAATAGRSWLVLCAALLPGALPAPAASAAPSASTRTLALPASETGATASRAGTPAMRQIELRTRTSFSLVGLRWRSAGAPLTARLRAQRTDGSWTAWLEVEAQQEPSGAPSGADGAEEQAGRRAAARAQLRGSSEPLWTGPARRLQVRISGARPAGLHATLVTIDGAPVTARAAAKRADEGYAGIQPRAAWDPSNSCKPRDTPDYGVVQGVVVHHTVGTNDYSQAQVPSIILGICKYHRDTNGWNDIGYNVLVDRFGGAWEGRAGGLTQAVVGAQAQGFNSVTSGISMLGTFTSAAPSSLQVATVARVAAWRLAVAGVQRSGTVQLTSAGGSASRYKAGSTATVPRVMGHRDVGLTECPGDGAYPLLGQIRTSVAAADPTLPANLPRRSRAPPNRS